MAQYNISEAANDPGGTGWLPPRPDLRDYSGYHKEIKALNKAGVLHCSRRNGDS